MPGRTRRRRDEAGSSEPPGGRRARRPTILIADDTTDTRELYADYLGSRGYTVITAHDGEAAMRVALEHVPDVIVMDLAMPQYDGITALRRIKSDPRTAATRVILLTGYPQKAAERDAYEAGADRFLTKPCLPHQLERHVKELRRWTRSG